FLHGVALLSGIGTPSLTAQGGQRRPLQSFNRDRDIPAQSAFMIEPEPNGPKRVAASALAWHQPFGLRCRLFGHWLPDQIANVPLSFSHGQIGREEVCVRGTSGGDKR
ncbi:hypothetical protein VQ045_20770, partial [Aurantimonas sp. E1-2-R+4]|uniref:hypothetical protein n=1 Tax=Aurantimonas sp. E1-2-R+4 TaxID=3113714 RepID=UPI002F93DAFD